MLRRGSSFFAGFVHRTTASVYNGVSFLRCRKSRSGGVPRRQYEYGQQDGSPGQLEGACLCFCWKDCTTGNVEENLIVFPDDDEFKKIENVMNRRVFLLKSKSSSRRLFFWMQEPKTDKDEEWCRWINEVINNPPSSNNLGGGSGRGGNGSDNGDLQYIMQNMSQQQLMQLFGGVWQMEGLSSLLGWMRGVLFWGPYDPYLIYFR